MRIGVQVADVGAKPLADDPCLDPGFAPGRGRGGGLARSSKGFRQECREQDGTAGSEQGLLQNALQLPDVARPAVAAQALECLRGESRTSRPNYGYSAEGSAPPGVEGRRLVRVTGAGGC